jgi:hypothetical protein
MKTYKNYEDIPKDNIYLGSELGDGSMMEQLSIFISEAINPIRLLENGHYHYFDLGDHNEQ